MKLQIPNTIAMYGTALNKVMTSHQSRSSEVFGTEAQPTSAHPIIGGRITMNMKNQTRVKPTIFPKFGPEPS